MMTTPLGMTLLATVAVVGCGTKDGSITKTDNGEVTTTTVTDKHGHSLRMEVDDGPCATAAACMKLGATFEDTDKRQTDALKRACDFGEATACGIAAGEYFDGKSVPKDATVARTLAKQGCDKTDALACSLLSQIYLDGDGVEADPVRALELAMRGCDAAPADETTGAVADACAHAGVLLAGAKPVDPVKVRHYMERGCAINTGQCTNLGVAMATGLFGPPDEVGARAVYKKACDDDIADACSALGRQLVDGKGGPKDAALAKTLFDKACKGGSKKGCINQKKFP